MGEKFGGNWNLLPPTFQRHHPTNKLLPVLFFRVFLLMMHRTYEYNMFFNINFIGYRIWKFIYYCFLIMFWRNSKWDFVDSDFSVATTFKSWSAICPEALAASARVM